MSNFDNITPLILTFNEAPNIARNIEKLKWAKRIVVIDSFSTDETLAILAQYPQVDVFQRRFTTAADQDNYGLEQIKTEWVLSMDADYILDDSIINAIEELNLNQDETAGYWANFKYAIFGKPLRGTLYPPRKVLYARNRAHYITDGHTQRVVVDGTIKTLDGYIIHDDRKSLSHWLLNQDRYLKQESQKLLNLPFKQMKMSDKLRWFIVPAPFFVMFYCLILRGGIFDGKHGWYYAMQRFLAETLLSLRLIEARIDSKNQALISN